MGGCSSGDPLPAKRTRRSPLISRPKVRADLGYSSIRVPQLVSPSNYRKTAGPIIRQRFLNVVKIKPGLFIKLGKIGQYAPREYEQSFVSMVICSLIGA